MSTKGRTMSLANTVAIWGLLPAASNEPRVKGQETKPLSESYYHAEIQRAGYSFIRRASFGILYLAGEEIDSFTKPSDAWRFLKDNGAI